MPERGGDIQWGEVGGLVYYLGPGFLLVTMDARPVLWASRAGLYATPGVNPEEVINLVLGSLSERSPHVPSFLYSTFSFS